MHFLNIMYLKGLIFKLTFIYRLLSYISIPVNLCVICIKMLMGHYGPLHEIKDHTLIEHGPVVQN